MVLKTILLGILLMSNIFAAEKTQRVYWQNSEQFTLDGAIVIEIGADKSKDGLDLHFVVLDKTIFYPKGGGQPSDVGVFITNLGQRINVDLTQELASKEDDASLSIKHYISAPELLAVGDTLRLEIDGAQRMLNSKFHSAGHIMERVLREHRYKATKGNHNPEDAWVEFSVAQEDANDQRASEILMKNFNDLCARNIKTEFQFIEYKDLENVLGEPVPRYISPEKPTRVVNLSNLGFVPCGGTHVQSSSELLFFKVISFGKRKKGLQKIIYTLIN